MSQELVSFFTNQKLDRGDDFAIRQLPITESRSYEFPDGPAMARVVYVSHPLDEARLFTFSSYADRILEDKFNEALRIVTELGAAEVTSQSFRGDGRGVSIEAVVQGVGLQGKGHRQSSTAINYHVQGTGSPPRDPRPLRWPDEPGFAAAVDAVLSNHTQSVSIRVESHSEFSVDSELGARLTKLGFSLGFAAKTSKSRMFLLDARFPSAAGGPSSQQQPVVQSEPVEARRWPRR